MQNKKLMITLASVCIAFVAVVTALVIVLVSGGQSAKSNVTVKFVATDVACEIEGKYEKVDLTAENRTDYWGFTGSMGKQLVINETTTNGKLNPSGDIELDTNYSRVVFQYAFTNTMLSSPMYIELTGMPDNDTDGESFDNIDMLYYNTYVRQDALFSGVYDEELRDSMGKLVVPAQCTKYVYLVVSVDALTEDANFIGEIEWRFYSLSNGKCGLEITIYGDYLVYLEYSLVGKYTGTVIDFSDDLYDHSNQNTNYNYDYFFVSKIEHENIPMDCYTLIIETAIVY